jgi:hypothetical protein
MTMIHVHHISVYAALCFLLFLVSYAILNYSSWPHSNLSFDACYIQQLQLCTVPLRKYGQPLLWLQTVDKRPWIVKLPVVIVKIFVSSTEHIDRIVGRKRRKFILCTYFHQLLTSEALNWRRQCGFLFCTKKEDRVKGILDSFRVIFDRVFYCDKIYTISIGRDRPFNFSGRRSITLHKTNVSIALSC